MAKERDFVKTHRFILLLDGRYKIQCPAVRSGTFCTGYGLIDLDVSKSVTEGQCLVCSWPMAVRLDLPDIDIGAGPIRTVMVLVGYRDTEIKSSQK